MRRLKASAAVLAMAACLALSACGGDAEDSAEQAPTCKQKVPDSALVAEGTLTYSTNATLPPVQYVKDGEIIGMRIDLVNRIAKDLCLKTKVVNINFDAQIPGVKGGRWDMINSGMFYTPERAKTVAMVPYEVQGVGVSVAKGNPENITKPEDMSGKTIGVEAPGYEFDTLGLINEQLEDEGKAPIKVKTFQTNADAFQALSAGQIEGVGIIGAVTKYYQKDGRFETAISGMNRAPLALGFTKENTVLANAVAKELRALKKSGWLDDLFEEYGATGYDGSIEISTGPLAH